MLDNEYQRVPTKARQPSSNVVMDDEDLPSAIQNSYRPDGERFQEANDNAARSVAGLGASQRFAAITFKILLCFLEQRIQAPGIQVALDLLVPDLCMEFLKPLR